MTGKNIAQEMLAGLESENARLVGVIADALAAMDRGEYGQVRRILVTGQDKSPMTATGVIARDGAT